MVYVPRTITNTNNSLKSTALLDVPIRIRKKKKEHFQPSHTDKEKEKRNISKSDNTYSKRMDINQKNRARN